MPDYKKMYFVLFNKITDIVEQLQDVQKQTEELYIDSPKPQVIDLNSEIKKDPDEI